jgi:hypothetical protein
MISRAIEGIVKPDLSASSLEFERDRTFGRGFLQGRLGLQFIDALVTGLIHACGGKGRDATLAPDPCPLE